MNNMTSMHAVYNDSMPCMRLRLASIAVAIVATVGCQDAEQTDRYHLPLVAYHPELRLLFTASMASAEIEIFRVSDDPSVSDLRLVKKLRQDGARALRLAVDRRNQRLWVANTKSVRSYDLSNYQLIREYTLPAKAEYARFTDLAVDAHGDVYVLARGGASIYRVDGRSLEMLDWLETRVYASDAGTFLANRFVRSIDGTYLIVASPADGQLLRIDVRTRAVNTVAMSPRLDFTCAILFWNDQSTPASGEGKQTPSMTVFDCLARWQAEIQFTEDLLGAAIRETSGQPRPALLDVRRK